MTDRKPKTLRRRLHSVMFRAPMMITCEEFEDFILDYLEGGLTGRQRFVFEAHLKICAECRAYLTEYRRAMSMIDAQRDAPACEVPEDLVTAILAARQAK